eukprot:TRINITY_DN13720_c0_g1_i1.p1 TRINITY_DN13720_c0_g1~~TRINITY_DN13720_c0_g1_i1.p1  ORF type:complete len:326 (-),score=43.74 TRINITY_DN13720_c0_g1_i1:120-1097(-)
MSASYSFASLALLSAGGTAHNHDNHHNPSQIVTCVFDALQATTYLSQAGIAIDHSTRGCNPINGEELVGCGVDVLNVVESLGFVSMFLSDSVSQCDLSDSLDHDAGDCATAIVGLIASIADMGQGGTAIAADCTKSNPSAFVFGAPALQQAIRAARDFGSETAFCVVYATQSAWWLARAGLNINSAVSLCEAGTIAVADCAAKVAGVIGSFVATASYASGIASQCSHGWNRAAGCSSDVTKIIASLAGVASTASAVHSACTGLTSTDRRLLVDEANATSIQMSLLDHEKEQLAILHLTEEDMKRDPQRVIRALDAIRRPQEQFVV